VRINGLDTHHMYRDVVDLVEQAGKNLDTILRLEDWGLELRCPNFMQGLSVKPPRSELRNHFRLFHHSLGTVFSLGFPIRTPMRDGC